jgi:hypothetical protein
MSIGRTITEMGTEVPVMPPLPCARCMPILLRELPQSNFPESADYYNIKAPVCLPKPYLSEKFQEKKSMARGTQKQSLTVIL